MVLNDYRYLLRKKYDIHGRCEFLTLLFNNWKKAQKYPPDSIDVVPELVFELVVSYFADIDRLKKFHGLHKANLTKIAAYTTAWWVRIKPIQIRHFDKNQRAKYALVNEYFALDLMLTLLYDKKNLLQGEIQPWVNLAEDFVYHFRYRHVDPQVLELAITALKSPPPFLSKSFTESTKD